MSRKKVEELVTDMATKVVDEYGFELVDVEFVKEGNNWYLRIYIDKPGGIMIDDCQVVSERISDMLDEADPIKQSYFLEVSSPGLDRPLKKESDFKRYKGQDVEVKLYEPYNGEKFFEGELVGLIDGNIVINTQQGELAFEKDKVAIVKRAIKF